MSPDYHGLPCVLYAEAKLAGVRKRMIEISSLRVLMLQNKRVCCAFLFLNLDTRGERKYVTAALTGKFVLAG